MANQVYAEKHYGTSKGILMFPDDYVAKAHTFLPTDPAAVTDADGRKVIKAGTVWPTNDASAKGVVFNDVVLQDIGETAAHAAAGALLVKGHLKTAALPAAIAAAAKTALPGIQVYGA